jgi:hypothetical protein
MTRDVNNLRDARLHKALAHAPDARDMPAQAIRNAIKNKANDAINTRAGVRFDVNPSWWKRFWASTGRASSPWNAAFATVLLGSIITVIWYGHDVPDATLDERPIASPQVQGRAAPSAATAPLAPAEQTPPASASVPAPALELAQPPLAKALPVPKPAKSPASSPKASDKGKTEPLGERRKEDASVSGNTESRMEQVAPSATGRAPAPMSPAPPPAPAIAAAAPPPAAQVPSPPQVLGRAGVLADQARSGAKVAAAAPASAAVMPLQWGSLKVVYRGRTAVLSRAESQALTAQVQALVASAVDSAALLPPTTPTVQLKWYSANATGATEVATFSLWGGRFVWQVGGNAAIEGVALSDQLDTLLASVTRVVPP